MWIFIAYLWLFPIFPKWEECYFLGCGDSRESANATWRERKKLSLEEEWRDGENEKEKVYQKWIYGLIINFEYSNIVLA